MQLSKHFSLDELTASEIAARLGINNTPGPMALANLTRLARFLEGVRTALENHPVHITSGYRCLELNRKLKSKDTSAHVSGLAADLICPEFGNALDICKAVEASSLDFDQVIYEYQSWCHFAVVHDGLKGRREVLTIDSKGTRKGLSN